MKVPVGGNLVSYVKGPDKSPTLAEGRVPAKQIIDAINPTGTTTIGNIANNDKGITYLDALVTDANFSFGDISAHDVLEALGERKTLKPGDTVPHTVGTLSDPSIIDDDDIRGTKEKLMKLYTERNPSQEMPQTRHAKVSGLFKGGRKTGKIGRTFNRCVKSVRKTVKARKGSTKESAAIAICTTSVLQTRGRTLKRYRKGRLVTQRRK